MKRCKNALVAVVVFCVSFLLSSVCISYAQPKADTQATEEEIIGQENSGTKDEAQADKQQERKKKRKKKGSKRKRRSKKKSLEEAPQEKIDDSVKENKKE